ncbi:hypothetical protein ACHWQZ_G014703 [Mnemiopsis leidyi]
MSRLRAQALVDNALLNPDSVISNLSSYQLSDIEKAALARGLKITLPPGRLKKGSYLANFELLFKKLNLESFSGTSEDKLYFQNKLCDCAFSSIYNFNSSRHTLNNMPPEELQALQNLAKNKDIVYSPDYYWRYADDTFCLFSNREAVVKFHEFLDSLHPSDKFDREEESDGKLSFLDTVIKRKEGPNPNISTRIKPTDKGLLNNFSSFVPDKTNTALIFTLVYQAYRIASDMLTFHLDITVLKNKLTSNGFPTHLIDTYIGAVLGRHHANLSQPSTTDVPRKEVLVVMPYLGPVSHLVKRQLTKLVHKFYPSVGLKFVYRRGFRIANMFNYKDKFPLSCKSMVVYYTQCKQCGPSPAYIGKTVNTVYERFFASGTGHLAPNNKNSALLDHLVSTGDPNCDFAFNDLRILDTGSYDEQIRFIESILLKYDKQNLNTCERSIELQLV